MASTTDAGQLTVRLNDVRPDGRVAMITYGVLNLRLRDSPAQVSDVRPGEAMDVAVPLDMVGYRIPAGHRLRISVSSANFPLLMPPPGARTCGSCPDRPACSCRCSPGPIWRNRCRRR